MITSVAKRCKGDGKRQCGAASQPHERLGEPSRYPHLQHFRITNGIYDPTYLYSIIVFSFYHIHFPQRALFKRILTIKREENCKHRDAFLMFSKILFAPMLYENFYYPNPEFLSFNDELRRFLSRIPSDISFCWKDSSRSSTLKLKITHFCNNNKIENNFNHSVLSPLRIRTFFETCPRALQLSGKVPELYYIEIQLDWNYIVNISIVLTKTGCRLCMERKVRQLHASSSFSWPWIADLMLIICLLRKSKRNASGPYHVRQPGKNVSAKILAWNETSHACSILVSPSSGEFEITRRERSSSEQEI